MRERERESSERDREREVRKRDRKIERCEREIEREKDAIGGENDFSYFSSPREFIDMYKYLLFSIVQSIDN